MIRMTRIVILSATICAGSMVVPANAVPVSPARSMHSKTFQQPENAVPAQTLGEPGSESLDNADEPLPSVAGPVSVQSEFESTSLALPGDDVNLTRGMADRRFLGANATIPSPLGDGAPTAHVVPLPTAAWSGLSMLALLGTIKFCRNYRRILT